MCEVLNKNKCVVVIMGTVFDIFEDEEFATIEQQAKWTLAGSIIALGGLAFLFFR